MQLKTSQLQLLAEVAIAAAIKAGELIQSYAGKDIEIKTKAAGVSLASQVVTEVDVKSQNIILELINPTLSQFDLALLTEETEDDGSRLCKDYFWCIDPLDGTLPFTEGNPGYSVSIAMVGKDGTPQIGVIYNPDTQTLYHAIKNVGAFKNHEAFTVTPNICHNQRFSVIINRSFLTDPNYQKVMDSFKMLADNWGLNGISITSIGGAAMNACWVLEQHPACYFKFPQKKQGGGSLWDMAASACIFNEAGAFATDCFGDPIDLNRNDSTFMNLKGIIYASDKSITDFVMKLYESLGC